jgi:hypothetical protein
MDMVGLDFIGPISPTTKAGKGYIIILVDYLSKYLFARAVPAPTADATWRLMLEVAAQFGWPLSACTDNGSHFIGEIFYGRLIQ